MRQYCTRSTAAVGLTLFAILLAHRAADAQTWDGGGANNNWTNGLNWVGDVAPVNNGTANIVMAGVVDTTPVVDVAQSINSLIFNNTAGAFTISGSPLTIGGSGITNSDAQTQTINSNIVLSAAQFWDARNGNLAVAGNISPAASLDLMVEGNFSTTLSGVLSGSLGLTKVETGTLTLSGTSANTYTGNTAINGGTLVLSKTAGLNAIASGTATVGDVVGATNDDVLRLGNSNQIANTVNMFVAPTGLFDLNGFSETINGTLTLSGGNVSTGAGTLTLGGNVTRDLAFSSALTSTISGNLALSGQRTFTINDATPEIDLDIAATITSGGIVKAGTGTLRLGAANTLPSNVRIDAGTVLVDNSGALGTGNVQFNGGAIGTNTFTLPALPNNFIIAGNVGFVGDWTTTISGNVTLTGGDWTISSAGTGLAGAVILGVVGEDVAGRSLTIDGAVSFQGSNANTYTGTTTVIGGGLTLAKSGAANGAIIGNLVIGDGIGSERVNVLSIEQINNSSTVTINSSGTLEISAGAGGTETIANLVLNGGEVDAEISTLAVTGSVTTNAHANTATIGGNPGFLSLGGGNIPFNVADGAATVDLDVSAAVPNGSLTKNGLGTMRLSGAGVNLIAGTTVNAGTLVLNKSGSSAIGSPLVIGDGAGGASSDVVRLDASDQITGAVPPLITESGLLALNNMNQILSGISLTGGNVTTGTGTLTLTGPVTTNASAQIAMISGNLFSNSTQTFDVANGAAAVDLVVSAAISTAAGIGITKTGAGTLRLSGNNTHTGATLLDAGTLEASADANLGAAASVLTFDGGTLRTIASFSTGRPIVVDSGGGTIESLGLTTLTGPISGTGDFTKAGSGTLILDTQSAQMGTVSVSAGSLRLADGTSVNVDDDATVNSGALLTLDNGAELTSGLVDNNGEIVLDGPSATLDGSSVSNSGLVRGRGRIDAPLSNLAAGEVRAATGELLQFIDTSSSTNSGRINLLGGTVEFTQSALTNNAAGQIVGNGTLDANSIANSGTMAFSGAANVLGDVTNNSGATIIASGGGPTTFFDDVVNDGEIRTSAGSFTVFFGSLGGTGMFTGTGTVNVEGDLSPGSSPAIVNFGGSLILGASSTTIMEIGGATPGSEHDQINVAGQLAFGGTLDVDLTGGFAPTAGDSFDLFNWTTSNSTFTTLALPLLPGGLMWNTTEIYTIGVLSVALPGDYNFDGSVDAADYIVWRKGLGTTHTPSDYDVWAANFGATAGAGSGGTTNLAPGDSAGVNLAVPEPESLLLLVAGGILWAVAASGGRHPRGLGVSVDRLI